MNRISMPRLVWISVLSAVAVIGAPTTVHAHMGVGPVHDLLHGLAHPLSGLDHIVAIVAVGIWAAQRGGRAIWLVPLSFIVVMALGGAVGVAGVKMPFVEPGVVLTLVVLGVMVAAAIQLPLGASMAIVSVFALVHGYAHGAEIPAAASGMTYSAGFVVATTCLLSLWIAFGLLLQRLSVPQVMRLAGAVVAICGVYLGMR